MLRVFPDMTAHNIRRLHQAGLCVSFNSDDPSYFGVISMRTSRPSRKALDFSDEELWQLARNGLTSGFYRMICATAIWPSSSSIGHAPRERDVGRVNAMPRCIALLAAGAFAIAPAYAQTSDATNHTGVFLRYLNAPAAGDDLREPPHLTLSLGGRRLNAVMDTGSTGVVVSASAIPGFDQLPNNGPAKLTYTSSGRIMEGVWVTVPVTIAGADGASVTTRPMPVLAVTSVDCTETARNCTPRDDPRHVAMIGMGFGRRNRSGLQADSAMDKNPFLNLSGSRAGALHRGYLVTREGVEIGVPAAGAPAGFATVRLSRNRETGDWSGAPACIAIADHAPACGTVLPDTGLTPMFLALPPDQVEGRALAAGNDRTLPTGTKVTIALAPATPGGGKPTAGYSFATGDMNNPIAPRRVILVGQGDRPTYVNTGVHLLNGFDYFFDADAGLVGYRPLAQAR
jgi:hypothetical protein